MGRSILYRYSNGTAKEGDHVTEILYHDSGYWITDYPCAGNVEDIAYGGELNGTKLYRNQILKENAKEIFSESPISDENGYFSDYESGYAEKDISISPSITIDSGLTILFDTRNQVYPKIVKVSLYSVDESGNEALLTEANNTKVSDAALYIDIAAENVSLIKIEAGKMNLPYARLKIANIFFGKILRISDEIMACDIIEQINPISEYLPYNTCDITMRNSSGIVYDETKRQTFEVYHNGKLRGIYYAYGKIDINDNTTKYTCYDCIGLLEKYAFLGDVYDGITIEELIGEIFTSAGLNEMKPDILPDTGKNVSGWIPITTCRDALWMVLNAYGWCVNTARRKKVEILKYDIHPLSISTGITNTTYSAFGYNLTDLDYVSSVDVKYYKYYVPKNDYTTRRYSSDIYGKGYKPIYVDMLEPSKHTGSYPRLMEGSTANRMLVDGTIEYTYVDEEGNQFYSDDWHLDVYIYNKNEGIKIKVWGDTDDGLRVSFDGNTMMSEYCAGIFSARAITWLRNKKKLIARITKDTAPGELIRVFILGGDKVSGIVTECRYSLIGSKIYMEATIVGS